MHELRAMHRDANLTLEEIKEKTEPILNQLMESVRVQESAADIMRFIVQDLLDYAQIKEGKFRKNVKVFDVREAVQTVMKIQRDKALNNGISLECKFENLHDGDIEEADLGQILQSKKYSFNVNTDEQRFKQVLLNLQSNAIKFTKKGGVVIRVSVYEINSEMFLKVKVEDTGIGISKENQLKLFKLFGMLEGNRALNQNGIGLGLVISNQLVAQFGG